MRGSLNQEATMTRDFVSSLEDDELVSQSMATVATISDGIAFKALVFNKLLGLILWRVI